jgi:hypothetical protein
MAKTYGLDSFGQIKGIRCTFNAELPGVELSRRWEWNPKTDTVSYEGKDKEGKPVKVTYPRSQPITAGRRTESPCGFPFRMCRLK